MRWLALAATILLAAPDGRATGSPPAPAPPAPAPPQQHDAPARAPAAQPVRFVAVGDLALGLAVGRAITRRAFDPFVEMRATLEGADLAFGNLEAALSDRAAGAAAAASGPVFPPIIVGPTRAAALLARAGFDAVSLANNHALDLRAEGLTDTLAALHEAGVAPVGGGASADAARAPLVREVRGVRVGLLAFTYGTNLAPHGEARVALLGEHAVDAVRALRPRVDALLVSVHWGTELVHAPRPSQVRLAHELVDAGADAVIGHHPHVLQSVEVYAGRPVVYSLGNFVFGPMPLERQDSAVLELELTRGPRPVQRAALLPVRLTGARGAPVPAAGRGRASVVRLLREASAPFATRFRERDDGALELEL